jgi:hypothetical protein
MQQIAGTIRNEGQAVRDRAEVFLVIDARREPVRWYGSFLLPADTALSEPGPYHLELVDGRHGDVFVSRVRLMECGHVGGFTGCGPLMEPDEANAEPERG